MGGIGWMVEDHLVEIVNLWRRHLARQLPGLADPALGYAAPVFLRELSRALREDDPSAAHPFRRCELLLKVAPSEGLAGVVHEFRLLRRALWEVLRVHGRLVPPLERSIADEKIDEAIATAIGRLAERPHEREPRTRSLARIAGELRGPARGTGAPRVNTTPRPAAAPTPPPLPMTAEPLPEA